jgi:hypothetical protein
MKPMLHALVSAKKFGGKPEDYMKVHDFIDSSKAHMPDVRHRALLHSSFGIYMVEQVFGHELENSEGLMVQIRDIAEEHVLSDLGFIPTVQDYFKHMPIQNWFGGKVKGRKQTYRRKLWDSKPSKD